MPAAGRVGSLPSGRAGGRPGVRAGRTGRGRAERVGPVCVSPRCNWVGLRVR